MVEVAGVSLEVALMSAQRSPYAHDPSLRGHESASEPIDAIVGLVARAQRGDADAFASIYSQRVKAVSKYLGSIIRDHDRADDIAADTFLVAWRKLPSLRDRPRFDSWLFRIARNLAINELKRHRVIPLSTELDPIDEHRLGSPVAIFESQADAATVRSAIERLSANQPSVLQLRFYNELPHAVTAQRTGKSEEAVRALQYRALGRLRHLFSEIEPARAG
jgi:RNA polymerase sigma-70 factor (ECF subfamily)